MGGVWVSNEHAYRVRGQSNWSLDQSLDLKMPYFANGLVIGLVIGLVEKCS